MEDIRETELLKQLEDLIVANLKKVFDPEINLNVYDLGLIYDVTVDADTNARVTMTLTSPNCPAAEILPMEVEFATRAVSNINTVKVVLTFDPPWNPDKITDEAKYQLGIL